jgi:hypothetical protein
MSDKIKDGDAGEFDPLQIGVSKQELIKQLHEETTQKQTYWEVMQNQAEKITELMNQIKAQEKLLVEKVHTPIEKRNEPGKRFDQGKIDYHLIPVPFLVEFAKLYTAGAIKYDPENWRKGMSWSRMIRCVWSHWLQWLCGIKKDPETGVHSCVMAAWNLAALYMYEVHLEKKDYDDRKDVLSHEDFQCPEEFQALREKYQKNMVNEVYGKIDLENQTMTTLGSKLVHDDEVKVQNWDLK